MGDPEPPEWIQAINDYIHSNMGYKNGMPLVCAAPGAKKLEEFAGGERVSLSAASNGAKAIFSFRLR
jgi:hypothetical protein